MKPGLCREIHDVKEKERRYTRWCDTLSSPDAPVVAAMPRHLGAGGRYERRVLGGSFSE